MCSLTTAGGGWVRGRGFFRMYDVNVLYTLRYINQCRCKSTTWKFTWRKSRYFLLKVARCVYLYFQASFLCVCPCVCAQGGHDIKRRNKPPPPHPPQPPVWAGYRIALMSRRRNQRGEFSPVKSTALPGKCLGKKKWCMFSINVLCPVYVLLVRDCDWKIKFGATTEQQATKSSSKQGSKRSQCLSRLYKSYTIKKDSVNFST